MIVVVCLIVAAGIYLLRVGIMQTYFPEVSNFRNLVLIALLLATSLFFSISIYRGKFIWFLDKRFSIKRILVIVLAVSILLGLTAPIVRTFLREESKQQVVRNDLDHIAIRDAAREILSTTTSSELETLTPDQIPPIIARTSPTRLYVSNGILTIHYGTIGEPFGFVIVPPGDPLPYGEELAEGIAYFETN